MDKEVQIKDMRKEVKRYIDQADEEVVKMVYAILARRSVESGSLPGGLEVDAETGWWETMPDNVKEDVEDALLQAGKGEVISHEEVKKKYPQWFTR